MIYPLSKAMHNSTIRLLPQEREGTYKFDGKFVATRGAIDKLGWAVIVECHLVLLGEVGKRGGLDYLQVFDIDGQRLWFIDDVGHVTALLPEDY